MYADESYVYVDGLDFNNNMITVKIKYTGDSEKINKKCKRLARTNIKCVL